MAPAEEARYRLRLAEGFLVEAREDATLKRFRSCVHNSQLVAENAAKAVLALTGPVGRTHNPGPALRAAIQAGLYAPELKDFAGQVAECAELMGPDVHIESDYGDESSWRTPWELVDEADASRALEFAIRAAHNAGLIVRR